MVAGNTGAGVYHDWPLERVLVDIKSIPELTTIQYSKVSNFPNKMMLSDVVADDTGAGVYHLERVLVDIKSTPELTSIQYSKVREKWITTNTSEHNHQKMDCCKRSHELSWCCC